MLRGLFLFAAGLLAFAAPANATQFLVSGTATGVVSYNVGCPGCQIDTPVTRNFSFTLDLAIPGFDPFGYTQITDGKFSFTAMGYGLMTTYVSGSFEQTDTGYTGTNLYAYDEGAGCYSSHVCSSFSAPTFSVALLDPSAVPEPSTWAMLMVGLFVVGAATRRPISALSPSLLRG